MTDRELLERAAKAAGIYLAWQGDEFPIEVFERWNGNPNESPEPDCRDWNPLTSDADAFRLADKLGLIVDTWNERVILASRYGLGHRDWTHVSDDELYDGLEATRRAITRAAAAIGEQK